ncbi:hypothetical protein YPPY66_4596, partial [Yersinia pestis PY-66]
MSCLQAGV